MRLSNLVPTLFSALLALGASAACTAPGAEEDALAGQLDDGKADGLHTPTRHNDIFFGTTVSSELVKNSRYHAWDFSLTGDASVQFQTYSKDWLGDVDTVLYVYKKSGATTWKQVARESGDATGIKAAELFTSLGEGSYRVIVKGQFARTRGAFSLSASCDGQGCPPKDSCLFGTAGVSRIPDSYVTVETTARTIAPVGAEQDQVVDLFQPASGQSVLAYEEAVSKISDLTNDSAYDVMGNPYRLYRFKLNGSNEQVARSFYHTLDSQDLGAIFLGNAPLLCLQNAPVCAFGSSVSRLDLIVPGSLSYDIDKAESLDELATRQLGLVAQYSRYDEDTRSAAEPQDIIDLAGPLHVRDMELPGGARFTAMTFITPEGEEGLIFEHGTSQPVALINENDIARCNAYVAAPRALH